MTDEDKKILEEYGFIIECESPLEVSLEDMPESRATGDCAEIIIDWLKGEKHYREIEEFKR